MSAEEIQTIDDDLIRSLEAFGQTLESEVDSSIRPTPTSIDRAEPRRYRAVAWLAAAALLLAAGFGLGVLWPDRSASIDSVGDGAVQEEPSPTTSEGSQQTLPDDSAPDTEPGPSLEAGPSTIDSADGAMLTSIVSENFLNLKGRTQSRSEVVIGAVVDELSGLDAFASYDDETLAALLTDGGLRITTTLDPEIHEAAIASIEELYPNAGQDIFEVGMLTIDNRTGAIVDISSSHPGSDALLAAPRLPGSAMKTMVLAALLEDGYQLEDTVRADGPCRFTTADGSPYIVGGSERPVQSIAAVTRSSNNCAFVRLGQVVGLDRVIEVAEDLGVDVAGATDQIMSLPLGSIGVDAVQFAGAYAALANDGRLTTPWMIASVTDADGNVLHQHEAESRQVVSADTAQQINFVLASNVVLGTGRRATLTGDHHAAGKTGTAKDFTDAWFVGYTDYYTAAVWLGTQPGGIRVRVDGWNGFGGGLPASIWGRYMDELHKGLEPVAFPGPSRDVENQRLIAPNEES